MQGDLQATQSGDGNWRATFYVTGAAHSIVDGSAWKPTPWGAVQMAEWAAAREGTPGGQSPKTACADIDR